jgi:hypothetical protein
VLSTGDGSVSCEVRIEHLNIMSVGFKLHTTMRDVTKLHYSHIMIGKTETRKFCTLGSVMKPHGSVLTVPAGLQRTSSVSLSLYASCSYSILYWSEIHLSTSVVFLVLQINTETVLYLTR